MKRYLEGFSKVVDPPWLVLGGGGLRGLAHVGAMRALEEAGIGVKGIIGTSIGALIGALRATGMPQEESHRLVGALERKDIVRVNRRAVLINGIKQVSIFRGDTLRGYFEKLLPEAGWDALEIPLLVNAVDLHDGSTQWFGSGARTDVSMLDAVYASAALPVFYPPLRLDGHAYVDGGTAHPLAIDKAASEGAERVIAIDVGAGAEQAVDATLAQGLLGVHQRVFGIMTRRLRQDALERWRGPPLLYVRPRVDGYGPFGFEHVEYFVEEGYRATREALRELNV